MRLEIKLPVYSAVIATTVGVLADMVEMRSMVATGTSGRGFIQVMR